MRKRKRPVVDETRAAKRPRQHSGLRGCGIAAIAVGAFLSHTLTFSHSTCKLEMTAVPSGTMAFHPLAEREEIRAALIQDVSSRSYPTSPQSL